MRLWHRRRPVAEPQPVEHVFVYGMLLDPAYHHNRDGGGARRALVEGWRLAFAPLGLATVERASDEAVWGAVVPADQELLRMFDAIEGYPDLYCRKVVEAQTEEGAVRCFVYVKNVTELDDDPTLWVPILPNDGYLDMIVRGYRLFKLPVFPLQQALARHEATRLGTVA